MSKHSLLIGSDAGMFGNFLYFIVALLIYATYQPAEEPYFSAVETLVLFSALFLVFGALTRLRFFRIRQRLFTQGHQGLDDAFHSALTHQSVLAVGWFALNIYGLSLPSFFVDLPLFTFLPTLQALMFLGLFVAYMAVVWAGAYPAYQRIYQSRLSRGSYVGSQISFAVPVLLPWLAISGISDLINGLPFETPKRFLSTPAGELSYFLTFLLAVAVFAPAIVQKFWNCRPLEAGMLRDRIEGLCARAGVSCRNILYWPIFEGRMITAGVMGLVSRFRYILVTRALLRSLTTVEIEAVIAHEIGHVRRKHLLFYLIFFTGYMVLSYAAFDLIVLCLLYVQPVFRWTVAAGLSQAAVMSALFSLLIIVMFLVYFRFIFGYFMRNFERQADIYVYRLFDNAQPLISTLLKIAAFSGQDPARPNWHHFSIRQRVDYLNRCEADRRWIVRHDAKVKKSIVAFALVMVTLAGVAYQLNFGEAGRRISRHFIETILVREMEKHPDDPTLLATLGDILYDQKRYVETLEAYEQALTMDPKSVHVLNNLAWLYATCDDTSLRDPERALLLARRAVELDPSPHVWDTLAESFYVNGRYAEAAEAETEALNRGPSNRRYYEDQLMKFKEAASAR